MIQEIVGLRYEFIHRHGHYMMLHRDTGLHPDELSEHQLRMLEANKIPRLLPLEIQEIDFRIHLLYRLTSKRMLTHVMKTEGFTINQYVKLLYTIICALDESGNYMLNEHQYVLRENFIFIGADYTDVFLTYLPFRRMPEEIPLYRQLKALVEQLGIRLLESERHAMHELLEGCTETFSSGSFKLKLLALMGESQKTAAAQNLVQAPVLIGSRLELPTTKQAEVVDDSAFGAPLSGFEKSQPLTNPAAAPLPWKKVQSVGTQESIEMNNQAHPSFDGDEQTDEPQLLTQRQKTINLIILTLGLALLWSMYVEHPNEAKLHVTAGISLLLIDVWYVFRYVGLPRKKLFSALGRTRKQQDVDNRDSVNGGKERAEQRQDIHSGTSSNMQNYYQELHQHTTLLSAAKPNATVFLGGGSALKAIPQVTSVPVIEMMMDGAKRTQPLKGDSIIIGRSDGNADIVLNEIGVSRQHAEIMKSEKGCMIKDAGSKNGTYLNGEMLVPYQAYPLQNGDTIRIVKLELIYKLPIPVASQ